MHLSVHTPNQHYHVSRCTDCNICLNGITYQRSLAFTPHKLITEWCVQDALQLSINDMQLLVQDQPDLILFGSGPTQIFPPQAIIAWCHQQHIGFEAMDTHAACRTFNLLASDNRSVVAAIILPGD